MDAFARQTTRVDLNFDVVARESAGRRARGIVFSPLALGDAQRSRVVNIALSKYLRASQTPSS